MYMSSPSWVVSPGQLGVGVGGGGGLGPTDGVQRSGMGNGDLSGSGL